MKHKYISLFLLLISGISFGQAAKDPAFLPPFNFRVDSVSLLATWEAPKIVLLNEDFEGDTFPPPGWSDTTLGVGWLCEENPQYHWWWTVPDHSGKQAQVNDDFATYSNDGSYDFLYLPVLDLTIADSFSLCFDSYFDGAYGQTAYVKYSVDNGSTWLVLRKIDPSLQWKKIEIDLSEFSGLTGINNFKLAFYTNDRPDNLGWWSSGWAVDNVSVGSYKIINPLIGYEIFLNSLKIDTVYSTHYQYHLEYNSQHNCGLTALYTDGVSDTAWHTVRSYYLPEPEGLSASYHIYFPPYGVVLKWYPPIGYQQEPLIASDYGQMNNNEANSAGRDIGDVILNFIAPSPINSCYGICDDGYNLWVTDQELSPTTIYQMSYTGDLTGVEITVDLGQSWIGGMAGYNNILYAILVGGPNAIVKIDLGAGEIVDTITGDWSIIPQQALTADFKNHEFYIGGWDGDMIWRTDFNGETISTHLFSDISGLAWNQYGGPDWEGSLWVVQSSSSSLVTELAPNYDWVIYQDFQIPGGVPYSGAGAAIARLCDERGNLWLCDKINNTIYLIDLYAPAKLNGWEYLPENLLGYNVYRDGFFRFFTDCTDPCWCTISDHPNLKDSSFFKYEVSALFDLSLYGCPGDTGESLRSEPTTLSLSFYNELDFFEDWSPGSSNYWELNVNSWKIKSDYGNNPPAAVFKPNQVVYEYEQSLETWQTIVNEMTGDVILEYDISLSSMNATGNEKLLTEVYDYVNNTWDTVKFYSNLEGSFDWRRDTLNITNFFNDDHFRIRFNAKGANSGDIEYWAVDNITIRQECYPPEQVSAIFKPPELDSVLVSWDEAVPPIEEWKQWDDGVNANGLGFGTSKDSWFGFAAHWTPDMLAEYKGAAITAIGFVPCDLSACFKIAIWTGDNKTPIYLQAAGNLVMNEWNVITLNTPHQIDISKDLYVGYKLSTYTGYPGGLDDGPAIDGFGNLIQAGPEAEWQTILDFNPDLSFNWNIKAFFERDGVQYESYYGVYRSTDGSEPELVGETMEEEFTDPIGAGTGMYCYKVKAIYYNGCESEYSPESCLLLTDIPSVNHEDNGTLKIYPNPASDVLFIEAEEEIESVCVIDIRGETVEQWNGETVEQWNGGTVERWNGGTVEIALNGLPPGLYLVRVETGSGVVGRKILIIK